MLLRLCACVLVFAACTDNVSTDEQATSNHRRPFPPPESIDACASSSAGDACSFEIDGHLIEGTCRTPPFGDGPLGCAPNQPPPEAVDACAGATAGDACSFEIGGYQLAGTCRNGPDGNGPLACAPTR